MLEAVAQVIFSLANEQHMAVACFLISLINLYRARIEHYKIWPRRLKAFNWAVLGLAFLLIYFVDASPMIERSWLRLAFALLVVGELSYHGDVIVQVTEQIIAKIKSSDIATKK